MIFFSRLSWADFSGNCFFMKNQDKCDFDFWRVMLGVILIVSGLLYKNNEKVKSLNRA